jgi:cytochrome P450
VFHTILFSSLPPQDKEIKRMAQEAFNLLSGCGETMARTMTTAMYHLHVNPHTLKRLKEELKAAMPGPYAPIDMITLENLPWLVS